MKRFVKCFLATIVILIPLLSSIQLDGQANTLTNSDVTSKCGVNIQPGVNPDFKTMNCLLTETALQYDVPPEIVKAIADTESGNWLHFDRDGKAIVTADGGIGIMQITNQGQYDHERLKNDLVYNIQVGVEILDQMFKRNDLPKINNKDRSLLEHWYFATMAYNGTKPINSPIVQETGDSNSNAYQEKIFDTINKYGLVKTTDLIFSSSDFNYDTNSTANINFITKGFHLSLPFTKTKHSFKEDQEVTLLENVRLRTRATTDSTFHSLSKGEVVTITGPFVYEENPNKKNHFVWYPVKTKAGLTGYIASSYLKLKFKDVPVGHYASESIEYLVDRSILNGVGNDKFGLGQPLTRWQAVLLLSRINNLSLSDRPDPGFVDVPKDHLYYQEIAAVVDEELFIGKADAHFEPNNTLTRGEMAVVLQRLYQFPQPTISHPFTDLKADWYIDSVKRLYDSGITDGVTKSQFGPNHKVTREQFAVFLVRAMDQNYRLR